MKLRGGEIRFVVFRVTTLLDDTFIANPTLMWPIGDDAKNAFETISNQGEVVIFYYQIVLLHSFMYRRFSYYLSRILPSFVYLIIVSVIIIGTKFWYLILNRSSSELINVWFKILSHTYSYSVSFYHPRVSSDFL